MNANKLKEILSKYQCAPDLSDAELTAMADDITLASDEEVSNMMRSNIVGVFSSRDTSEEALKYAQDLLPNGHAGAVATGIMVYHNTLMNILADHFDPSVGG